jgi:DNA polymerase/3'-5' exonuclease PolX
MPQNLDKFGIAAALQEIATLMDLKGGQNRFKAKAYNAGARAIQGVANLDQLVKEDRLTTLPRIGDALASQIKQLYLTGESSVLNGLRKEFPAGVVELSTVPGLSIEKIKQQKNLIKILRNHILMKCFRHNPLLQTLTINLLKRVFLCQRFFLLQDSYLVHVLKEIQRRRAGD